MNNIVETEIALKPYKVRAHCPNCNTELVQAPEVYPTYPPQYQYTCPNCSYSTTSVISYPYIKYEENTTEGVRKLNALNTDAIEE